MRKSFLFVAALLLLLVAFFGLSLAGERGLRVTNEMIYEKLLEMEKRQAVLEAQFREFKESVDKRFEQVDTRFEELREDMNKRFEQIDRRIDETNRRIDETNRNMRWLGLIMGGLVAAVIAIVVWDRRTAVRVAVREAERELEERYELELMKKIIGALRELAKGDKRLAEILRHHGLL